MIYFITPGVEQDDLFRWMRADPRHSFTGANRIRALLAKVEVYHLIFSGTGVRHREIARLALEHRSPTIVPVHFSPICGTADVRQKDGIVLLADETKIPDGQYFDTTSTWFSPRPFIENIRTHALVCTDPQMLVALGLGNSLRHGIHLYKLEEPSKAPEFVC